MERGSCRGCGAPLRQVFADLGMTPLANSFLTEDQLDTSEPSYPLRAMVCATCFLVQLEEFEAPEAIFSDYPYFSSYSSTWLAHCADFATAAIPRLGLGADSLVVELASNDGCLLRNFSERGIRVLGIEPAANVAGTAIEQGIDTRVNFFGSKLASDLARDGQADLIVGNNVLAHVPDLHDFVEGIATLLAPGGTVSLEFPHLLRLMEDCQFDTIYHEHFSYFSLLSVTPVLEAHGLAVVDIDELPTHGGSLRLWLRHAASDAAASPRVDAIAAAERGAGLDRLDTYLAFDEQVAVLERELLGALTGLKAEGLRIAGYGAPAKGNTLLNSCGIGPDILDFTVDASPWKQGTFLPGSHIPVYAPDAVRSRRPDVLFVLPWNIESEIIDSMSFIREWGGRFLVRRPGPVLVD